jgi:hypothetical protein
MLPIRLREVPARVSAGALILHSGLEKRSADTETAQGLHGFASTAYPVVEGQDPKKFVRLLSTGEIALGAALLTPLVPTVVAGAALTAFSAGLLGLYLRTPGMRKEGSLAPTPQGLAVAKDVWMLGIGLSMVVDALGRRRED